MLLGISAQKEHRISFNDCMYNDYNESIIQY